MGFRALCQGDLPQGLPVPERALDLAQEAHIRLLVPRVAATLGAAYALAGRAPDALPLLAQARAELSTAIALYRAMEMTYWLPQAETALAQLGVTPGPPAA
jgi:hypothetical protein